MEFIQLVQNSLSETHTETAYDNIQRYFPFRNLPSKKISSIYLEFQQSCQRPCSLKALWPLKHWYLRFESCSRHDFISEFSVMLSYVNRGFMIGLTPSKESY